MLVLTRKTNERILIGDGIELVVIAIIGNRVQLGFSAPESVQILRSEVADRFRKPQTEEVTP